MIEHPQRHANFAAGWGVPVALFLSALLLRLWGLGSQPLWLDEAVTWSQATKPTWRETLLAEPNHGPVWRLLTRLWLLLFPASAFSLRLPAALLGALCVPLAWSLARRANHQKGSEANWLLAEGPANHQNASDPIWLSALAVVAPLWVAEAQEARMYAALMAEALGTTILYLRWRERGKTSTLVAYAALTAIALHTHYYAVWVALGHAAHAAWMRWKTGSPLRPLVLAHVAAGIAFLPWFLHARKALGRATIEGVEPLPRLFEALWRLGTGPGIAAKDAARAEAGAFGWFEGDPVRASVAAALWFVPIVLGLVAVLRSPDRDRRALVVCSVGVPILGALLLALRAPLLHERYLVFLAPWLLWLAVQGALAARGTLRVLLLAGLVVLNVGGFLAYRLGGVEPVRSALAGGIPYSKEPWPDVVRAARAAAGKDGVVLIHARFLVLPWDFEAGEEGPRAVPLPSFRRHVRALLTREEILGTVPQVREARRVVLIVGHETRGFEGAVLDALKHAWGEAFTFRTSEFPQAERRIRLLVVEPGT